MTDFMSWANDVWNNDAKAHGILNTSALPFWVLLSLWLLVPKFKPLTVLVRLYILAVCAFYSAKLVTVLQGNGFEDPSFGFESIMKAFTKPTTVLIGWAHYIAFDMLTGYSIVTQVHASSMSWYIRILFVPVLFLTLMFGPTGYLVSQLLIIFFRFVGVTSSKRKVEQKGNF